jgi:hypothetical protein
MTLLRMRLGKCDPAARRTLDGLEAELEALRQQVTPSAPPGVPADPLALTREAPA